MDNTSKEWRKIGGKGTVKPLSKSKNCRDWELSVSVGKNPETGKYERAYRRVHGMNKTEALAALDAFKDELRAQFGSAQARHEIEREVEYKRLMGELEKQKAALEVAQANVDKYRELLDEKNAPKDCPTIDDYSVAWREFRVKTKAVTPGTSDKDRRNCNVILKHLGGKKLNEITLSDVQRFYAAMMTDDGGMRGKALSGSTAQGVAVTFTMIMKNAVRDASVPMDKNPCEGVPLPKCDTEEKEILSDEDRRRLVRLMTDGEPNAYSVAVMLMLCCGLRRGEACALRWMDFDREGHVLHIRKSFSQARKEDGSLVGLTKTKTPESVRDLPLGVEVFDMLERWHTVQGLYLMRLGLPQCDERPIIMNALGGHMLPSNLHRWWNGYAKEHGFKISPHGLRHTFASNLIAMGFDIATVAALLGQKKTGKTLLDTYTHAKTANMVNAMNTISTSIFAESEESIVPVDIRKTA